MNVGGTRNGFVPASRREVFSQLRSVATPGPTASPKTRWRGVEKDDIELPYQRGDYLAWKRGRLHDKWFQENNLIFDEDDLRIARSQHPFGIHFGEWFTAIHYAGEGYNVLVEKYTCGVRSGIHRRKREFICEILGDDALKTLRKWKKRHRCQPPDLFVFNDKEYFFVEVKKERDSVRACQTAYIKEIERTFHCGVVIADLQLPGHYR
jgi:hypothetical protein